MQLRPRWTRAGHQQDGEMSSRGTVKVYHPDYTDHGAVLLSLPATDGHAQTAGVHRDTVHVACAIIANNRYDGYLSASRDASAAHDDLDRIHILPAGIYYFHIPRPLDAPSLAPFPVVPNFRTWVFPHGQQIPGWKDVTIQEWDGLGTAEAVVMRDQACRVTASKEAIQAAHIIPKAERQWFTINSMSPYCRLDPTAGATVIDRSPNGILLRADVHKLWDTYRLFFVPKSSEAGTESDMVAHVAAPSAELLDLYHNVSLQELKGVPREYLFARFAYGVLRQLRTFLQSGRRRWLVVQDDDGNVKIAEYSALEGSRFTEDQGPGRSSRSPTKSPSKSPKRRREDEEVCSSVKRQKHETGSFDSALAGMDDWAEDSTCDELYTLAMSTEWHQNERDEDHELSTEGLLKYEEEDPHPPRGRQRFRFDLERNFEPIHVHDVAGL